MLGALLGGFSPHSALIRRSAETTSPAFTRRTLRSLRCLGPPTSSGDPPWETSRGPRIRYSILPPATEAWIARGSWHPRSFFFPPLLSQPADLSANKNCGLPRDEGDSMKGLTNWPGGQAG